MKINNRGLFKTVNDF